MALDTFSAPSETHRASEYYKTQVEDIEALPLLAPVQKAWLLLLREHVRPAATLQVKKVTDQKLRHIKHVLDTCGFNYVETSDRDNEVWFDVALDKRTAVELHQLRASGALSDPTKPEAALRYAQLLGYPKTSREYFVRHMTTNVTAQRNANMLLQKGLLSPQERSFVFCMLDPDGVHEELQYVRTCHNAVQAVSKKIYNQVISRA